MLLGYLVHDKLALISAIYLLILVFAAIFGPMLVGDMATKLGLRQRNLAPFSLDQGWLYVLGADTLGRSILARLVVGAQNTLGIAAAAVRHVDADRRYAGADRRLLQPLVLRKRSCGWPTSS